ncbi:cell cycle associated protein 1 S homeolog [Xenopus laevis]|uniref:Cell cycle associated protein 1 S homeolog n=1 Tax=Xenopus laevis TaxID=8355 RepID=Q75T15_XENLA|nr:cell cycle associated protein 1 S homeolog [Xenopus laevis]BAD04909.1 RNA granule protein 105 [Xenopus laevis]
MPSATSSKAVPGSTDAAPGNIQTEAMKQILGIIDKKLRNLEKKKGKLDDYQDRLDKGERLNQDQMDAVTKHQEVVANMEFARELQRNFMALGQDMQKTIKKAARREQLMREEAEQKRLKTVLEFQFVLDKLGDEEVRNDLKQGLDGVLVVSEEELSLLDEFYKLVNPDRDTSVRLSDQYEQASIHLWDVLDSKEKSVCGTTYKSLKDLLDRILQSGYFDSAQNHQNGLCEEEEEEEPLAAPPVEEQAPELEPEPVEEYTEPSEVESTEFVNRQFMTEAQYSGSEKEQVDEWTVETVEVVNSLQQAATPPIPEPLALNAIVQVQPDPIVRRQRVQDLMAQMQGPYNFMQDSMLEFESQPMDPAIVSAQPMNLSQSMDLPQMLCPPVHSEPRPSQPIQVPDTTQVALVSSPSEAYTGSPEIYQPSHPIEARTQNDAMEQIQASLSLNPDPTQTLSSIPAASQPQVFQTGSNKPLHSSGINVNAAPFQSMQTVFNMNAPVPPVNEPETLKQNQYQASYNQTFPGQPHQVEQTELQPEQLQTVVNSYHATSEQAHQAPSGHQQPTQQNAGFPRNSQPFYNNRGMARGGQRGNRGMMNGYRGQSNGFRGGYDGYRAAFPNTPNSGYPQAQFNAPRDYSNNYQRDGYQQNFKRGAGQGGPRVAPRGHGGPPRPSRGIPQMNPQQVN